MIALEGDLFLGLMLVASILLLASSIASLWEHRND